LVMGCFALLVRDFFIGDSPAMEYRARELPQVWLSTHRSPSGKTLPPVSNLSQS
jgi:hypothetical protein